MKKLLSSAAVVLALAATVARANDPVDVAGELKKIIAEQLQKQRAAIGSQTKMREAMNERKAALEALVKQAEDADPTKLPAAQQAALASACMQLNRLPDAVKYAEMAIKSNPDQTDARVTLIQSLARQMNVDAAEAALAELAKKSPDAAELSSMHEMLYFPNLRARKPLVAAEHVAASVDIQCKKLAGMPDQQATFAMRRFAGDVDRMVKAYGEAGKSEAAVPHVDTCMAAVAGMMKDKSSPALARLASDLVGSKVKLLAATGKKDQAQAMLVDELDKAKKSLADHADDANCALRVAGLMAAGMEAAADKDAADKARGEYLGFLGEQVKKRADNREMLMAFVNANATAANALAQNDRVADAMAMLKSAQETLGGIETTEDSVKKSLESAVQQLQMAGRRFEAELMRAKLIGQAAIPVETSDWVNGSPVAPADTKGKVVLLDFWAVWCGPCVATFPHLREWHDKYADKGLVIVGATQYYGYGWNADEKHIERVEALSHQDEQAAMTQFAKHHELRHALAVMPDRSLSEKYGVTGIPQAVVIDRAGKVRMIKVGSGEPNAKALHEMIEKCLAETPEAAAAASAGGGSGSR